MILDSISVMGDPRSSSSSGIGRRRGQSTNKKSNLISIIVIGLSFTFTLLLILFVHYASSSDNTKSGDGIEVNKNNPYQQQINERTKAEEETTKHFGKWAGIISGELHLVDINARSIKQGNKVYSDSKYQGVTGRFCKLDWDKYKKDPPSYPMFRMLVSESECDKEKNIISLDLVSVVHKAREYDKSIEHIQTHNDNDVHVMPPSGFVFHESRVGSTLVANSLTAMNPSGHRVYSESHPINNALKACKETGCDIDTNADLLRDVVYLMGRTRVPTEKHMFFKVSSAGSKNIDVMRKAFPRVPWIFVFRDPVQTMMSHLDPEKLKTVRGGTPKAVCLRGKQQPPSDLVSLVSDMGSSVKSLTYEEYCAAHLATLCTSALKQMKESDGKGVAVEYDNLIDKLISKIIPDHFNIPIDDDAKERIQIVGGTYSKSKGGDNKVWVEDSKKKDDHSTPQIRSASDKFLSSSYTELKKYTIV